MKWRRGILVCALIMVGVVIVISLSGRKEPSYKGKSLSVWLRMHQMHPAYTDSRRHEAYLAVRQIGTNAIPFLLEDIRGGYIPKWMFTVSGHLPRPAYVWWQTVLVRRDRRSRAIEGFIILGADAVPAIRDLLIQLDAPQRDLGLAEAVAATGKAGVPVLTEALTSRESSARYRGGAAWVLGLIGPSADESVGALVGCLNEDQSYVSEWAAWALPRVTTNYDVIVPALTNALQAHRSRVRAAAVESLTSLGGSATSAVPALRARLNDGDLAVRDLTTNALRLLAPGEFPGER